MSFYTTFPGGIPPELGKLFLLKRLFLAQNRQLTGEFGVVGDLSFLVPATALVNDWNFRPLYKAHTANPPSEGKPPRIKGFQSTLQ